MLPAEGSQLLEDLAADLIARNSTLNAQVSDTPKGAVRLDFPVDVVDRYFPKLYSPVISNPVD